MSAVSVSSVVGAEGEIISLQDREHLLLRPDTLCGSTKASQHKYHVYLPTDAASTAHLNSAQTLSKSEKSVVTQQTISEDAVCESSRDVGDSEIDGLRSQFRVEKRVLVFAPALKSVFQEILTNALDRQFRDDKLKKIEVWINCEEAGGAGWVRVKNDGQGLPVVYDEERSAWKPTIAFSHFRSGTNFVDNADGPRWTAGRNGYGCKATNVFSKIFRVETADPRTGLAFSQTFSENMSVCSAVKTSAYRLKKGYTDVSFLLDFARLGVKSSLASVMSSDVQLMLEATTVAATACLTKKVNLSLNGKKLNVKNLKQFASVFLAKDVAVSHVAYDASKNSEASGAESVWEVCAVLLEKSSAARDAWSDVAGGGECENVLGFVNSLQCCQGTHVNFAFARLTSALEDHVRVKFRKSVDFKLSPAIVRRHVFMVVKLLVDSPEFSSQTKEKLTTPANSFGFEWQPSAGFMKTLVLSGIVNGIYQDVQDKELLSARKMQKQASGSTVTRRVVIAEKYDAATNVTKPHSRCSLLVTEGDSARALAVAGLAVVGRANFGIFALKGKPLNVRNSTVATISKNKEIMTLLNILGLKYGETYTSLDVLNYKKLVIFSDQDPDGAHIGGLIVNVIHALFPSILSLDPAYVQRFPTPLVRVTEKGRASTVRCFYAKAHFDEWWTTIVEPVGQASNASKFVVKYFKGLGTSTSALAREYFSAYDQHLVDIVWSAASDELMTQMFQNDNAAARRELLTSQFDPLSYVDYTERQVSLRDFINKEVLPYSNYSNERNIPSLIDGLKPVQRKALFTFLGKNIVSDVKVAQVAAQIAAHTMYHHGEQSLVETVIGMAQDHVGVSNINMFRPEGQFGSRLDSPSVHSAPRYIFTGLDPIARAVFRKMDDDVLTYRTDEGSSIEPEVYAPVIPMVLVNGAFGIGTGWSTSIPMFNPRDLIGVCRLIATSDDALLERSNGLLPWYDGFTGEITRVVGKNAVRTRGRMTVSEDGCRIHITELPVGVWTHSFVEDLEQKWLVGSGATGAEAKVSVTMKSASGRTKVKTAGKRSSKSPRTASKGGVSLPESSVKGSKRTGKRTSSDALLVDSKQRGKVGRVNRRARTESETDDNESGGDVTTCSSPASESSVSTKSPRPVVSSMVGGFIVSIERLWTDSKVDMVLHCDGGKVLELMHDGLLNSRLWTVLGMQNEIRMSNMHLHDVNGRLRLYENVYEIVREFGVFRMDLYEKRRLFMIKQIEDVLVMLVNKLRFVQEVVDEKLSVFRLHDDAALDSLLDSKGYARLPDFSYLINMPLRALTMTRVARLSAEMDDLKAQVGKLRLQSNTDLWLSDLDELECELACFSGRKQARYATENSTTKTKVRGTTSTISVKTGRQGAEGFKRSKQRGC
jgi:DNA topoisomerase-2